MPKAPEKVSAKAKGAQALQDLVFKKSEEASARSEGKDFAPRAMIELDAHALVANYRAIQAQVPEQGMLPMIKADAYGHGVAWVAQHLLSLPNLVGFGVASLEEGAVLRKSLGMRARRTVINVFSGAAPWSEEKGHYCEQNGLTPVIANDADWAAFLRGGWHGRIPYELKFNTGMNRIGMNPGMARAIVKSLKDQPVESHPQGFLSHLAMSEQPESRLSQLQLERFKVLKSELAGAFPGARFHLANSGGIWNAKHFGLKGLTDIVRPGLALYGVPPWPEAPARGLIPVMTYTAAVIAVHALKVGETVGYGATYKITGKATGNPTGRSDEAAHVATLAAGYADGVARSLSNQGYAWLNGRATRFVGIVSMDMCAVAAFSHTRLGERVELLGPHVDIWGQAKAASTIPYELLTSMSTRVQRKHV